MFTVTELQVVDCSYVFFIFFCLLLVVEMLLVAEGYKSFEYTIIIRNLGRWK